MIDTGDEIEAQRGVAVITICKWLSDSFSVEVSELLSALDLLQLRQSDIQVLCDWAGAITIDHFIRNNTIRLQILGRIS